MGPAGCCEALGLAFLGLEAAEPKTGHVQLGQARVLIHPPTFLTDIIQALLLLLLLCRI